MNDIIGCALWDDAKEHNIQTNDPTEKLYRVLIDQMRLKYPGVYWGWLESCGVNAMTNCLAVTTRGRVLIEQLTWTPGGYRQQLPHLLIGFLNDEKVYDKLTAARLASGAGVIDPAHIQGNRVPQFYVALAEYFLGIEAHFEWGCSFEKVKEIVSRGNPAQICLKSPSHYVSAKAFDKLKNVILSDDSWPARTGGSGFSQEIKPEHFTNIENWLLWYDII